MRENELTDLLYRMAAERGVDAETAAEELATVALPSFVDARAFRGAVIQTLETQMRAQMEQRLQSIRRRFDVDSRPQIAAQPRPAVAQPIMQPKSEPYRQPAGMDGIPEYADATMTDLAPLAPAASSDSTPVVEEELPSDATMVWTTRNG